MTTEIVYRAGPRATVKVTGDIEYPNAHRLPDAVQAALGDGAEDVLVDLSAVDFMGAAALDALVQAHNIASPTGARVTVRCPRAHHRRLFAITGLQSLLEDAST